MSVVLVNVRTECDLLLREIENRKNSMNEDHLQILQTKLREWVKDTEAITELDTSLQDYIHTTKNGNQIFNNLDFQNKMSNIGDDSLIIYVKKAQLYKVYEPDGFMDFERDESSHYHKPQYGPVYEVVRDEHPQKLMIVITDGISDDRIRTINQHIIEFVRSYHESADITMLDLNVYNNDNNTEFVVSSLRLKNLSEKERVIERFIKFMKQKGEMEIANKIQIRPPQPDELDGARFYKIPTLKRPIGPINSTLIDQMLTPNKNSAPVVINNTYIIGTVNTGNMNNGTINNVLPASNAVQKNVVVKKSLKTFYKFLYDTRPPWYLENTLVSMDIIELAYRKYFNDNATTASVISRKLNGKLFVTGSRPGGIVKKKLIPYDTLKTLF